MSVDFILHGAMESAGSSGISTLFGAPLIAAIVTGVLAAALVYIAGWRAGFVVAAVGVLFLACGLIGDVVSHSDQSGHRHEILHGMMTNPTTAGAHELMELDGAEARNVWHLASAAGQGLLIVGLAGAAFILWRQRRVSEPWQVGTRVPMERVERAA